MLCAGFDLTRWNGIGIVLPADLGPFGLPGCMLWTSLDSCLPRNATAGADPFQLPIPNNPLLAGMTIGFQALAQDLAASNGIGGVSDAVVVRTR